MLKIRLLLGGLVLLSLLLLTYLFPQLVQQVQAYQAAQNRYVQTLNAPDQLREQQASLADLSAKIKPFQSQSPVRKTHLNFAQYLDQLCKAQQLRQVSLPETVPTPAEGSPQPLIRFTLEGSYANLLRGLYQLEIVDRVGTIPLLRLQTRTLRRQQQILLAEVHLLPYSIPDLPLQTAQP